MMRHGRLSVILSVCGLVIAAAWLPGCGKAPEQPPEPQPTTSVQQEAPPPIEALELPLNNPEIGITVESAPEGLVATYNGEHWIEFTDVQHPLLRFTFVSSPAFATGVPTDSIAGFESAVQQYDGGKLTGSGDIDTPLGKARWVSGTFQEDGESLDQLLVSAPNPSGAGDLFITSNCPSGVATVEQRLETIRELLADLS